MQTLLPTTVIYAGHSRLSYYPYKCVIAKIKYCVFVSEDPNGCILIVSAPPAESALTVEPPHFSSPPRSLRSGAPAASRLEPGGPGSSAPLVPVHHFHLSHSFPKPHKLLRVQVLRRSATCSSVGTPFPASSPLATLSRQA